jgi:hypothetical protein
VSNRRSTPENRTVIGAPPACFVAAFGEDAAVDVGVGVDVGVDEELEVVELCGDVVLVDELGGDAPGDVSGPAERRGAGAACVGV